jgi:hypothetical protein
MLYAVPSNSADALLWLLSIVIELLITFHTWNIDKISEELHLKTSSKWHIDPDSTSSTCRSPVEIGKFTAFVFATSIFAQVAAIVSVKLVEWKRKTQYSRHDWESSQSYLEEKEFLEGLPEVLYICHSVAGVVSSGIIGFRSLELLFRHPGKFKFCPHVKIVGIFKFSVVANVAVFIWYAAIAGSGSKIVFAEVLGLDRGNDKAK